MTTVMIKPLRTYEDRGELRRRNGKAYSAPAWLAKDLALQGLCEVMDGKAAVAVLDLSIKHAGRGKWVVIDAAGEPVGEFSGTKEEAAEELARLVAEAGGGVAESDAETKTPAIPVITSDTGDQE